ncbi:uncharacterized protein LOC115940803 [Leptonychotes weddellii]|uniref:Uncharacterized protein LOC115940803 n=1 Tax=Leptonychotes weddellii TaxID=9713 RepID=A0A7F8QRY7_LEPWE|nr:uncharacterized protein LOC115940803 [Leptonychotes weddellii]
MPHKVSRISRLQRCLYLLQPFAPSLRPLLGTFWGHFASIQPTSVMEVKDQCEALQTIPIKCAAEPCLTISTTLEHLPNHGDLFCLHFKDNCLSCKKAPYPQLGLHSEVLRRKSSGY